MTEEDIKDNITKEFQIYKNYNNKVNYSTFNPVLDNELCLSYINNENVKLIGVSP